jgi:hypothetical protein
MFPEAHIVHQTSKRLRIKIPSQKGNPTFFSAVQDELSRCEVCEGLEVSPLTGSVLVTGEDMETAAIAEYAERCGLFKLQKTEHAAASLPQRAVVPLGSFSTTLRWLTGGEVDLPGLAFLALLMIGLYQIMRGNLTAPPWYTAFWYAFGIFTKSLMEKSGREQVAR